MILHQAHNQTKTLDGDLLDLSLIIPAYNEARRLPATLQIATSFLNSSDFNWELIVADDGSTDETAAISAEWSSREPRVRHLRLPHRGKAATVRAGIESAEGRTIIFTDADLSTPIEYVAEAEQRLRSGWDVVVGTREGAGARRIGEPAYRHWMGRLYNYVVQVVAVPGMRDTQCGFKAFRAGAAREIFSRTQLYRDQETVHGPLVTGFDVEVLFLARKLGLRICELPVTWRHVEGSKVRPGIDSLLMVRDAFQVRLNDLLGRYETLSLPEKSRRAETKSD